MINLTKKSKEFIEKNVLGSMGYSSITDENLANIVDFIIDNFEVPLAQAKEAGENIDEQLLSLATEVVTEITSAPEW
ncbi:MAG: hypothetical protein ACI4QL_01720 [Candidatus Fimimonas sp.]